MENTNKKRFLIVYTIISICLYFNSAFSAEPSYKFKVTQSASAVTYFPYDPYTVNVNGCTGTLINTTSSSSPTGSYQALPRWNILKSPISQENWTTVAVIDTKDAPTVNVAITNCPCLDDKIYEMETGQCKPDCSVQRAQLIASCGGNETDVDWTKWNDQTCTGECLIPCQQEKTALILECGGSSKVDWTRWSDATCSGACLGCDKAEYYKAKYKCPADGLVAHFTWDEKTCTGRCDPLGTCDQADMDAMMTACGNKGVAWVDPNDPDCPYKCEPNCNETYTEAHYVCGAHGVAKFNWDTCDYVCDKCPANKTACETSCADKGGLKDFSCVMSYTGQAVTTCVCGNDGEIPPGEDSLGTTPDAPPSEKVPGFEKQDPEQHTPTTPNENPNAGTDTDSDKWLKSIKESIDKNIGINDKILEKNGRMLADLDNIDENLRRLVNNGFGSDSQSKADSENLKRITDNTAYIKDNTKGIRGDIKQVGDSLGGKLDGIKHGIDELIQQGEEDGEDDGGGGSPPNGNQYSTEYDPLPEQQTVQDVLSGYNNPYKNAFDTSKIQIGSSQSSLSYSIPIMNRTISGNIDFSKYHDLFAGMGVFILFSAYVSAFFIITRS